MKYFVCIVASLSLIACPIDMAWAQKNGTEEGPVGIFQSQSEYHEFMGNAKAVAYGEGGSPELKAMIPLLNDIALNQPIGSTANKYQTTGGVVGLLANDDVRAEIEMVDDQYERLQEMNKQIQQRSAEQLRSLDFSNQSGLMDQIRKIQKDSRDDLNALLLPHQVERLQQIRMQSLLRNRSLAEILTSDPIKAELEITDNQSVELREFEKEVEADLRKEIAKLREKARGRLLSKLKPSQKEQAETMIGDLFEFADQQPQKNLRKRDKKTSQKFDSKSKYKK